MERKIRVDDMVEILRNNPSASGLVKGDVCKVTTVEERKDGIGLLLDNKWWVLSDAVKPFYIEKKEFKEGMKFDEGKLRYDLVSPYALEQLVKVLTSGAVKYGDRNWEKGLKWGRVFGACMRHLWAWWAGKRIDEETGLSPLAHAFCCIMFLLHYEQFRQEFDDRVNKYKSEIYPILGKHD